jgi:glycosyltransferase involved in cell wall biosynthesis
MSRFGQRMLAEAGLDALHVPHGIETKTVFTPDKREEARSTLGVNSRFVVAMNAANKDAVRKGFPEQMLAFAEFRSRHPEAILMLHSLAAAPGALDLQAIAGKAGYPLARAIEKTVRAETEQAAAAKAKAQAMVAKMGIMDSVKFADQYAYLTGMLRPEAMAKWKAAADVGTNCSLGEGFGLANIEFQACGTPMVLTDATAMTELAGPGWLVKGEPFWNSAHAAWWTRPSPEAIAEAYEDAWSNAASKREASRKFAVQYDADTVLEQYWKPALDQIMDRAHSRVPDAGSPASPHGRERDAVLARLEAAHSAGVLDAGEFGRRSHRAVKAETAGELAALLADLPAAAEAA